ncbi:MAG: 2-C-methyl-D-erythritol 4-phosphate cytidylyltransferase [Flavobacteriales bacterium]
MKNSIVIVAGGKGSRMNSELPKQFMLLSDVPVLMHTLERFAQAIEDIHIVLVLPKDHISFWKGLCQQMDFDLHHEVVEGGKERFDSVKNGLTACPNEGVIGVHDGVRPLLTEELILRCYTEAAKYGSALPVVPITQSLRKMDGESSYAVDRKGMLNVQTPQCFGAEQIKAAYNQPFTPAFTDDATVFEAAGNAIHLVDGEETNVKITTQADLKIAEAILGLRNG